MSSYSSPSSSGGWRRAYAHSLPNGCALISIHAHEQMIHTSLHDGRVAVCALFNTRAHALSHAVGWAGRYSTLTFKPHVWWIMKPKHNSTLLYWCQETPLVEHIAKQPKASLLHEHKCTLLFYCYCLLVFHSLHAFFSALPSYAALSSQFLPSFLVVVYRLLYPCLL